MSELFILIFREIARVMVIKTASIHTDEFATIEGKRGNKIYSISIRCAEEKQAEN